MSASRTRMPLARSLATDGERADTVATSGAPATADRAADDACARASGCLAMAGAGWAGRTLLSRRLTSARSAWALAALRRPPSRYSSAKSLTRLEVEMLSQLSERGAWLAFRRTRQVC